MKPNGTPLPERPRTWRRLALGFAMALAFGTSDSARAAALHTQTIQLQAGWNAIHLEVTPTNADPSFLFAGLPLDSVWDMQERLSSVEFIQDVNEPVWNQERWAYFVPTNRLESRANRLFAILGGQPYLVRMTNAATWQVTGRPVFAPLEWVPDAYNLRGFPVDPANPPTFQTFFRHSPAHYNSTSGQLQPMYRLTGAGQWTLVTPSTQMESGKAYWVYSRGGSEYQGPMELRLEAGREIDFATALDVSTLQLFNRGNTLATFTIQNLFPQSGNPLLYRTFSQSNGYVWLSLPNSLAYSAASGTNLPVNLGVRRTVMTAPQYETVLSFNNGAGVRRLVPVSVETTRVLVNATPQQQARNNAGLWVGSASITAVSEAHSGQLYTNGFASLSLTTSDGTVVTNVPLSIVRSNENLTPRPVKAPAELRLLVHVDTNGTARLLKEVIQMWQDGTYTNDLDGRQVAATPGRYVLVTDDSKIGQFKGAVLREGELVGRRFSTVAFDFPSNPGSNYLVMTGAFAVSNSITTTFTLPATFPTNPFRHRYHPDHNDPGESLDIKRTITLQLTPPSGSTSPDFGTRLLSGVYAERVEGLHKTNIVVAGTFTLRRVSETGVLDR